MNQEIRNTYLEEAKKHLVEVQSSIAEEVSKIKESIKPRATGAKVEDKWVDHQVNELRKDRVTQLERMSDSPYFNRTSATFDYKKADYYIGKFSFPELGIYSWVAPIASIRFDNPGKTSYILPNGTERVGTIQTKDTYHVEKNEIILYTHEAVGTSREIVFEGQKAGRKSAFLLPEIVSSMEKAQDMIIRAHHKNPLVISGPAGSGKTTLALHRIAYMVQAPATMDIYKNNHSIVFVQDEGSKAYFSHLLPDLGITTVTVATFAEWAMSIVQMEGVVCTSSYQSDFVFEHEKIQAMKKVLKDGVLPRFPKKPFAVLEKIYRDFFSEHSYALWMKQKSESVIDRIDATLLLHMYKATHKKISVSKEFFKDNEEGELVAKRKKIVLDYRLMVVDEFQNYIPEQLSLMLSTLDDEFKSVMYVGDIGQQINPGALKQWSDIGESIPENRLIKLEKVYRNTKQILMFAQSLGFSVNIPDSIPEGSEVAEVLFDSKVALDEHLQKSIASRKGNESIGIICFDRRTLEIIKNMCTENELIKVMSPRESQGLEFDTVLIVGFDKETYFEEYKTYPTHMQTEKQKIDRDLLYIALTRAMAKMEILRMK